MNYSRRHSYYVRRTLKWLEACSLRALKVETNFHVNIRGRTFYTKRDLWGADIIYRSVLGVGLLQVKTSTKQVSDGVAQLTKDSDWPSNMGRYVVVWPKGRRLLVGPLLYQVGDAHHLLKPVERRYEGCGKRVSVGG